MSGLGWHIFIKQLEGYLINRKSYGYEVYEPRIPAANDKFSERLLFCGPEPQGYLGVLRFGKNKWYLPAYCVVADDIRYLKSRFGISLEIPSFFEWFFYKKNTKLYVHDDEGNLLSTFELKPRRLRNSSYKWTFDFC